MKQLCNKLKMSALSFMVSIFFSLAMVSGAHGGATIDQKAGPSVKTPSDHLNVHFIDVGNGDSILIDLGATEILIDGGLPSSNVYKYLEDYVDGSLDGMVATHPHPDHIGGLLKVLESFNVDEIWVNGEHVPPQLPFHGIYEKFIGRIKVEGAIVHTARRGQTIDIGILSLFIIHPDPLPTPHPSQGMRAVVQTMNNNSIVLRLRYGNIRFLFTGDAHKEAEADILRTGLDIQADILKVGAHGTMLSSSDPFLKAVTPKVAIYMAGEKTGQRGPIKPHQDVITALKKAGADVYGTQIHGTIIITTDGQDYRIITKKTKTPL